MEILTPMEIRVARPDEYAAAGELVVDAYRRLPDAAETAAYEPRLRDVAGRAAVATVLVAVGDRGRLLGSVTYVAEPGPLAESGDDEDAHIRMLAVAPGTGRRCRPTPGGACVERAAATGKRRILLKTRRSMATAHRLYERLGFRREPSLDREGTGAQLIGYSLEISTREAASPA